MHKLSAYLLVVLLSSHVAFSEQGSMKNDSKESWSWKSMFLKDKKSTVKDSTKDSKVVEITTKKPAKKMASDPLKSKTSKSPKLPDKLVSKSGMEFQLIGATKFQMGSDNQSSRKTNPRFQAEITKPFYIGKFEVTQRQWIALMGSNPSRFKECGQDCPVESVSWEEVQEFVKKLNGKEGRDVFRLPTEAEWELAAGGGNSTEYHFGDNHQDLNTYAWYDGNSVGGTAKVGQKKPNTAGLFDMHGNIAEWVQDWYGTYAPESTLKDPTGAPGGSKKVIKGGCWYDDPTNLTSASRNAKKPAEKNGYLGFRLIRTTKDLMDDLTKVADKN